MKIKYVFILSLLLSSCGFSSTSSSSSESSLSSSSTISTSLVSTNDFNPYNYIKSLNYEGLNQKLENKEDFICVLSSSYCRYCQSIENDIFNYMYSAPYDIYIYKLDQMFENLEKDNNDQPLFGADKYNAAKEEYRYLASCLEKVGDFIIGEEGGYMRNNYTTKFGPKEPSVVYPATLLYIDGELLIEFSYLGYGWSSNVDNYKTFINTFINLTKF